LGLKIQVATPLEYSIWSNYVAISNDVFELLKPSIFNSWKQNEFIRDRFFT